MGKYFDYWENYNHTLHEEGQWSEIRFNPARAPVQYPPEVYPPANAILKKIDEFNGHPSYEFIKRVCFLQAELEHGSLSEKLIPSYIRIKRNNYELILKTYV